MRKIPVECYTRVVGYYRPVDQCNKGKKAEIGDRLPSSLSKIKEYIDGDARSRTASEVTG